MNKTLLRILMSLLPVAIACASEAAAPSTTAAPADSAAAVADAGASTADAAVAADTTPDASDAVDSAADAAKPTSYPIGVLTMETKGPFHDRVLAQRPAASPPRPLGCQQSGHSRHLQHLKPIRTGVRRGPPPHDARPLAVDGQVRKLGHGPALLLGQERQPLANLALARVSPKRV